MPEGKDGEETHQYQKNRYLPKIALYNRAHIQVFLFTAGYISDNNIAKKVKISTPIGKSYKKSWGSKE